MKQRTFRIVLTLVIPLLAVIAFIITKALLGNNHSEIPIVCALCVMLNEITLLMVSRFFPCE